MVPSSLWQLVRYFLKLGTIGFGGPIALVEYMERDLVEQHRWFSRTDYVQGLALAELAPGPMATQLAIYLGYIHSGIWGATCVGIAFVIPSFLMVVAIAAAYVQFGGLRWMQALFYGIAAAVVGIIARSAYKLTKKTIKNRKFLWAVYLVMAVLTAVARHEYVSFFLLAGLVSMCLYAPPSWMRSPRMASIIPWLGILAPQGQ